jgi:hypothetical protein
MAAHIPPFPIGPSGAALTGDPVAPHRRRTEYEELRRLIQLGHQLANLVEMLHDPLFANASPGAGALGMDLVRAHRKALDDWRARESRHALRSLGTSTRGRGGAS